MNEAAFPGSYGNTGMTLRDYFAGQALAGFAASANSTQDWLEQYCAESAYSIADAMLAERAKGGDAQ